MDIFFLCAAILLAAVFIAYFAWKLIKYIAYNLSHAVAKGIYDARNGVVVANEKPVSSMGIPKQINKVEINLSIAEKRIRSDWLRSLFTYLLGSLAISLGCYFFIAYHGNTEVANEILVGGLGGVIALAIYTAIMFFFAYVKFGTKWIGWFLFVSPIRTVLEGIKDLTETFSLPDLTITGIYYVLIVNLFSISLYIYFWMHCKRLYELNGTIKKRKIEKEDNEFESIPVV